MSLKNEGIVWNVCRQNMVFDAKDACGMQLPWNHCILSNQRKRTNLGRGFRVQVTTPVINN